MDTDDRGSAQRAQAPRALRITFAWQGNAIRVAESVRVPMIAPPPVSAPPVAGQTGYWMQVNDASGRVLWHRPLSNPIRVDAEAFSDDPRRPIARVPLPGTEGRFTVVVPDVPDAASVSLHGPPDARAPDAPAGELLAVPIDALRKFVPPPPRGN